MLALPVGDHLFLLPAESGRVSTFGGPGDAGVHRDETGAVSGERLRDLDPMHYYIAMRWAYVQGPFERPEDAKRWLAGQRVVVLAGVRAAVCRIVDWGPAAWTGRVADLSPGAVAHLGLNTGDVARFKFAVPGTPLGPADVETVT